MKTKTKTKLLLGLCVIGLLTGCETTGFSRREQSGVTYPNYILALKPAGEQTENRKVETPIRIAVAQVGESAPPVILTDVLRGSTLIQNLVGLPAPGESARGKDVSEVNYRERVDSLCRLAASANADYVFLCGGDLSVWSDSNALKIFDLTIVGSVLVPSTRVHAEGKAAGALVDVRTREPILFVNVEADSSRMATSESAYNKRDALSVELRDDLSRRLAHELLDRLSDYKTVSAVR